MSLLSETTLTDAEKRAFEELGAELAADFDMPFRLWLVGGGNVDDASQTSLRPLDNRAFDEPLDDDSQRLLLDSLSDNRPAFLRGDASFQLAVPSLLLSREFGRRRVVALAVFPLGEWDVVERLAKLRGRLGREYERRSKADYAADSMAAQVTANFEELMLLRSMSDHLQLSDVPDDPAMAARRILPALQTTLKAEHLAVLHYGWTPDSNERRAFWAGDEPLSADACQELLELLGADNHRPTVDNEFQRRPFAAQFPLIRELAVAPMGRNGWVLAFNRHLYEAASAGPFEEFYTAHKFGTVEATLMTSAAAMLATHFHNLDLLRQKQALFNDTIKALVNAVDARDPYTRGHSERVGLFSKRFAEFVGMSRIDCDRIYLSGLLHDVGKIGIPDATLQKPGRLTEDEFAELKKHPDQGRSILANLHSMQDILPGVLYHHERYDGKGYPHGLAGNEIPIEGRLMAICDAYDAMTSNRPYRHGMPQEEAEARLREGRGTQWDPQLTDKFLELMPEIIRIRDEYEASQR